MAGRNQNAGYGQQELAAIILSRPTTGRVFVVAASGNGNINLIDGILQPDYLGTQRRFATITLAIAACTANIGDTILVAPGHTETVSAAAGLALSTAGVRIIGLGEGSNRPTITLDTATTTTITATANNVTFENFIVDMTGFDAIASGIVVSAADVTFRKCRFILAGATNQATLGILTTAAANRLLIDTCDFYGTTDAGTTAAVRLVGGDGIIIKDSSFVGAYTAGVGAIQVLTTATTNVDIARNYIYNNTASSTACITGLASTTGVIRNNVMRITTDAGVAWIGTPGNTSLFLNYGVNNNGETGIQAGTPSV